MFNITIIVETDWNVKNIDYYLKSNYVCTEFDGAGSGRLQTFFKRTELSNSGIVTFIAPQITVRQRTPI